MLKNPDHKISFSGSILISFDLYASSVSGSDTLGQMLASIEIMVQSGTLILTNPDGETLTVVTSSFSYDEQTTNVDDGNDNKTGRTVLMVFMACICFNKFWINRQLWVFLWKIIHRVDFHSSFSKGNNFYDLQFTLFKNRSTIKKRRNLLLRSKFLSCKIDSSWRNRCYYVMYDVFNSNKNSQEAWINFVGVRLENVWNCLWKSPNEIWHVLQVHT